MEHPCHKCEAVVEDGIAFCPQCSAPQIRVAGGVSEEALPALLAAGPSAYATKIQWAQALPSAALAGLIAAALMFIPLGAFGLGMLAAGVLVVVFYHRRYPFGRLTAAVGARLGAVSGIFGFATFAIFTSVEVLVFHSGGQLRAALLQAVQQSVSRNPDPQAQQILDYLKSPPGLALVMALGLAVMLVAFLVLSSLGGALGAVLLRRREKLSS